ncbi:MAG: histidinol dehydrogenase, partial [Anaerorhabdus sp.]
MRTLTLTKDTTTNLLKDLLKRSPNNYQEYEDSVNTIIEQVRINKDAAVFDYTRQFDGANIDASNVRVTQHEIDEAYTLVEDELVIVMRKALDNIRAYHEKQKQYSWFDSRPDGVMLGQKVTPIA